MRLLRAIYEKTGGRSRAVRDVTELETGLTADEARAAWRSLVDAGLIERFSMDYVARLSIDGVTLAESRPAQPAPARRMLFVRGHGTAAREAAARFVEAIAFEAVVPADDPNQSLMQQVEGQGNLDFVIVFLTADELGWAAGATPEFRPSPGVLMELGYLMGRFGVAKVCVFAIGCATDFSANLMGLTLESFGSPAEWQAVLRRQLERAGFR